MQRSEKEVDHVLQVKKLSLSIFDQLISEPSPTERFQLESAALLHDIGWSIRPTGKSHHKASEQMILEHKWVEIPPDMIAVIANTARYHRKSPPKSTHPRFAALNAEEQNTVRKLAAILRVADALDRSHMQWITSIRSERLPSAFIVHAVAEGDLNVEQHGVEKKSDLFELVFALPVRLKRVDALPS